MYIIQVTKHIYLHTSHTKRKTRHVTKFLSFLSSKNPPAAPVLLSLLTFFPFPISLSLSHDILSLAFLLLQCEDQGKVYKMGKRVKGHEVDTLIIIIIRNIKENDIRKAKCIFFLKGPRHRATKSACALMQQEKN